MNLEELISQAENTKNVELSVVLRKALRIAKKLNLEEFATWINQELKGYESIHSVPDYRRLNGRLVVKDPFYHTQFFEPELEVPEEVYLNHPIANPITYLENLNLKGNIYVYASFHPDKEGILKRNINSNYEYAIRIQSNQMLNILELIRDIVLNWLYELDEQEIEINSKSNENLENANQLTNQYIVNIQGDMVGSQIMNGSPGSNQQLSDNEIKNYREVLEEIHRGIDKTNLPEKDARKVKTLIEEMKDELSKTSPDRTVLGKAKASIKRILEGATADIVAKGALSMLSEIDISSIM